jgi:hypothetical protein
MAGGLRGEYLKVQESEKSGKQSRRKLRLPSVIKTLSLISSMLSASLREFLLTASDFCLRAALVSHPAA